MNDKVQENKEKYAQFAEHARELLFRQQERFARIDQKAAWHLSSLTVLIGAIGFFYKWIIDYGVVPPSNSLEWCLVVSAFIAIIMALTAWLMFFQVIKHHKIESLNLDESVLEYVKEKRSVDFSYYVAKRSTDAFAPIVEQTFQKAKWIAWGYRFSISLIIVLVIQALLFTAHIWTHPPDSKEDNLQKIQKEIHQMPDERNVPEDGHDNGNAMSADSSDSSPDSPLDSGEPDFDSDLPKNIILTEGYDPSSIQEAESDSSGSDSSESDSESE